VIVIAWSCTGTTSNEATNIVKKSIAYHDVNNQWSGFKYQLDFTGTRPNGPDSKTLIEIDNSNGYFRYTRNESNDDVGVVVDSCFTFDEKPLDCEATKRKRNYWLYVWGQPMKLMDASTQLENEVVEEKFEGFDCYRVKVIYPQDTWYFYIDKDNYRLRSKKFYKDEANNKGEWLIYSGEVNVNGMRFPKEIKWINTDDDKYLGTDILTGFKKL